MSNENRVQFIYLETIIINDNRLEFLKLGTLNKNDNTVYIPRHANQK